MSLYHQVANGILILIHLASTMSKQAKEKENDEFGQLLARFETGCGEAKKQFEAISAGPLGVAK